MSHEDVRKPSAEYVETHGEAFEAHQAALASQYQPGTEEERKLVWKIDKRIVVSDQPLVATSRVPPCGGHGFLHPSSAPLTRS